MASVRLIIKMMECPVCLHQYDLGHRLPKALRCIHTVCNSCLDTLAGRKASVSCPTCRKDCAVSDIANNYTVVDILEALCEGCMTEERQELCHHCKKHLCKACLDEHAKNFHSEVKENVQVLVQEMKKAVESSLDQSALEKERQREDDIIHDIKRAIQHHKDELDKLEKELEKQAKLKKDINLKKHVNWREKLDSEISKAKLCIDRSENVLGSKFNTSCTTEAMSAVLEECQQLLAEIQKAKDEVPMLCPYKFEADLTVPTIIGRVVWTAEKYKMARYKSKVGSFGSGREEFNQPISVACTDQHVIVMDKGNHRIKVYDYTLNLQTVFGQKGSGIDEFNQPWCVCVGHNEELFITDPGNNRVKVCTVDGKTRRTIGETDVKVPMGIALNDKNELLICNKDKRIVVLDINGQFIRNIGNLESGSWPCDNRIRYILIQKKGRVMITIKNQNTISVLNKDYALEKEYTTNLLPNGLREPSGMAEDSDGNLIIADEFNHRLVVLNKQGEFVCTIGSEGRGYGQLSFPSGVYIWLNDIFVCERGNHRLQVFEIPDFANSLT